MRNSGKPYSFAFTPQDFGKRIIKKYKTEKNIINRDRQDIQDQREFLIPSP
jgi:hypothetical protein